MLYWPTERGSPRVGQELALHPTEQSVCDEEWLVHTVTDLSRHRYETRRVLQRDYSRKLADLEADFLNEVAAAKMMNRLWRETQDEPVQ